MAQKTPKKTYEPPYETRATNFQMNKAACEASGGYWDEATQTCIPTSLVKEEFINRMAPVGSPEFGKKQKRPLTFEETQALPQEKGTPIPGYQPPAAEKPKITQPEIFIDQKTGRPSGITLPDGRTFLGLSSAEVSEIFIGEQAKRKLPEGAQIVGTAAAQRQAQQQAQQLINPLTGEPVLTEADILAAVPQEPELERMQAIMGGAIGAAGGGGAAAIGAKLGALGGSVLPGIGTAAGAIVGAIGGYYGKITYDKRQDVKQAKKVGLLAYNNFGQTTNALNAGLISKDLALKRWKEDLISLYAARENLKRETSTDLNRFLSGGADELAQVEDYIRDVETIFITDFMLALSNPDPARINYSYLQQENLSSEIEELK